MEGAGADPLESRGCTVTLRFKVPVSCTGWMVLLCICSVPLGTPAAGRSVGCTRGRRLCVSWGPHQQPWRLPPSALCMVPRGPGRLLESLLHSDRAAQKCRGDADPRGNTGLEANPAG